MKLQPTKGLIYFLLVLVLSLAPAALTNGATGYLPSLTVLLSAALSLGHLLLVKNRLRCQAKPERSVLTRGEDILFLAEVENRSRLPIPNLSIQFFLSDSSGCDSHTYPLHLTLSPRERRKFSLTANFAHIGVYEAGLRQLVVTDMFGLFRAVSQVEDRCHLDIQPRLLYAERLPVDQRQTVENDRANIAAPLSGMDYVGVRDYAYGDPIKTIQWKLSAHAGSLMTKQMESYTNSGVVIVLDFCVPAYDRETRLQMADGVAETGAAAGHWAVRNGMDYLLLLPGEDGQLRRCTPSSFQDLRPWLPYMELRDADKTDHLARVLREECGSGHSQSNVLLCAADLTEETLSALRTLKRGRKNPALYLLLPENLDEARRKLLLSRVAQLHYTGIPCRTGKDAGEVLL